MFFSNIFGFNSKFRQGEHRFRTERPDQHRLSHHPRLRDVDTLDNFTLYIQDRLDNDMLSLFSQHLLYNQDLEQFITIANNFVIQISEEWFNISSLRRMSTLPLGSVTLEDIQTQIRASFVYHLVDILRPLLLQNMSFSDDDIGNTQDEVSHSDTRQTGQVNDRSKLFTSSNSHGSSNQNVSDRSNNIDISDQYMSPQDVGVFPSSVLGGGGGISSVTNNSTNANFTTATTGNVGGFDQETNTNVGRTDSTVNKRVEEDDQLNVQAGTEGKIIRRLTVNLNQFAQSLAGLHRDNLLLILDNRLARLFVNMKSSGYVNYSSLQTFD
jgi:hypothetical protein